MLRSEQDEFATRRITGEYGENRDPGEEGDLQPQRVPLEPELPPSFKATQGTSALLRLPSRREASLIWGDNGVHSRPDTR